MRPSVIISTVIRSFEPQSLRRLTTQRPNADVAALLLILALTVVASWDLVVGGTMVGSDAANFFYPWFSRLGETLSSGEMPLWNPYHLSGVPFAGDPQSGWMYLPAMLLFSLLPVWLAIKAYMLFHLLLAGIATYALARMLRMSIAGALLAAIAYEYTGMLYIETPWAPHNTGIMAWFPVTLLGAEMAISSRGWAVRALGWGVSGLGVSQSLAIWLGQGSYYVLLALGGFIAYRTLLAPPDHIQGGRARVAAFATHGAAVLLFGFGLAAAGLLPRLEYNALSNLPGGYGGAQEGVIGGWAVRAWARVLRWGDDRYAGATTVILAVMAPLIARARHAVPYFATVSLTALILTGQRPTPLHSLLYQILPRFAELHPHSPERVALVLYLSLALLAGATLSRLPERNRNLVFLPFILFAAIVLLAVGGIRLHAIGLAVAGLTTALCAIYRLRPQRQQLLSGLLILVVFLDLLSTGHDMFAWRLESEKWWGFRKLDLGVHYAPSSGADRFLLARGSEEQFRYFGYDPQIGNRVQIYRDRWMRPETRALLVNNVAIALGLQDIQAYNPIHLARYDNLIVALNGRSQPYRRISVLPSGLTSPLLDLLNVRYIVVPAATPGRRNGTETLQATHRTVYEDGMVRVLERPRALPRAWIVHAAQQVAPGQALEMLATGAVDPRETALLEQPPPQLAQPADASMDRVSITEYEHGSIRARTVTGAPGLLMLSEMYYPAWKAYVDGHQVPLYAADHGFRAAPAPAGEHTVEFRYESVALRIGATMSAASYAALLSLAVLVALKAFRARGRGRDRSSESPAERSPWAIGA